jgi:hypothetical protein
MRRLTLLLAAALLVAGGESCKRKRRVSAVDQEPETGLRSMVHTADPRVQMQLVKGFHEIEQNAWRWTAGTFTATLRPPASAAQKGASLMVQLTLPDAVLAKTKAMTLSANVNGTAIPGETFSTPGNHTYRRDVPAAALAGEAVTVDFSLDRFLKAGELELRELGIVVLAIGLEAK